MKNLKKVTAGFLSLSLLTCVGATQAFADNTDITDLDKDGKQSITATVGTVATITGESYQVNLTWGSFKYNYEETWDANDHDIKGKWTRNDDTADKITITNNSSTTLYATLAFSTEESDTKYKGVSASYHATQDYTADATNPITVSKPTKGGAATAETVYVQLTGKPTEAPAQNDNIGTVTVTISDSQAQNQD